MNDGSERKLKVFLCHAHSDAAAVGALFRYLRREGVNVWLDKEKLLPGADWDFEIRRAVRETDVVVVCLSKQFNQAGYRQKEVKIALDTAMEKPDGEIFVIPARLEECDTIESLRKWHWVDLFEEGGRQKLIYALRARANSIGASLRRRQGTSSVSSRTKNQEPAKKTESALGKTSIKRLRIKEGYEIQSDIGDDIWIDKREAGQRWYVARGTQRLGRLVNIDEYRLLDYLIQHKGEVCNYNDLIQVLTGSSVSIKISQSDYDKALLSAITSIRLVVEENPREPKILIDTGIGYKLDW